MRSVRQPGPAALPRIVAVPAEAVPVEGEVPAGGLLLDGLVALLATHGVVSGSFVLSGGGFGPLGYVIPALSPGGVQAAFYSDVRRPAGVSGLAHGAVTVGVREGKPFFHCHALWTEADGRPGCGHVLPDETVVAAPVRVNGAGLRGARFMVAPDAETGFSLFGPVPDDAAGHGMTGHGAVAVRLAPNQDLVTTLETVAAAAGFDRAVLHGGVASTVGARFTDGRSMAGFATELLVIRGVIAPGASTLDIAIVDLHGTIEQGRLLPRRQPGADDVRGRVGRRMTALATIWAALGGAPDALNGVRRTGFGDLPSVYGVSELAEAAAGAAALAVAGLAGTSEAWVDRRLASLWFGQAVRPSGWEIPGAWDAVAGDYQAADGWIRLHTNAPHHRAAALRVLGVAPERSAVAGAVARWRADTLEAAVVDAGGCAAAMRDRSAWAAHPQGRAVAGEPLVHWTDGDAGDAPRWPVPADRPLAGVRVLDLTRVLAGPTATRFLAGFGAEVLPYRSAVVGRAGPAAGHDGGQALRPA